MCRTHKICVQLFRRPEVKFRNVSRYEGDVVRTIIWRNADVQTLKKWGISSWHRTANSESKVIRKEDWLRWALDTFDTSPRVRTWSRIPPFPLPKVCSTTRIPMSNIWLWRIISTSRVTLQYAVIKKSPKARYWTLKSTIYSYIVPQAVEGVGVATFSLLQPV